ncbi:MAG: hypothetical protein G01um101472_473 [Parcubacteria group bacterium Gr01-1014_72]|nr:MAG: hypothetical protein G01um101472_473 [Parcubacteria group bacterium Gr01-1014_72]
MRHFHTLDEGFIRLMRRHSVAILRIALGVVFLWFGLLKVFGESPVREFIALTYSFLPADPFILVLGVWETAIGLGLIFKKFLRVTLGLLWLQMLGTFGVFLLEPSMFFSGGNPLLLTMEGEFVVKNIVLAASGIVIGGYAVGPFTEQKPE